MRWFETPEERLQKQLVKKEDYIQHLLRQIDILIENGRAAEEEIARLKFQLQTTESYVVELRRKLLDLQLKENR